MPKLASVSGDGARVAAVNTIRPGDGLAGQGCSRVRNVLARDPGDRDRPVPADVAGQPAGEGVREDRAERLDGTSSAGSTASAAARCSPTSFGSPAVSTAAARASSDRRASRSVGAGAEKSVTPPLSLTGGRTGGRPPPTAPCGTMEPCPPPADRPVRRHARSTGHSGPSGPDRVDTTPLGVPQPRRAAGDAGRPAHRRRPRAPSPKVTVTRVAVARSRQLTGRRAAGAGGQPGRRRRRERPDPAAVGQRAAHGRRRDDRRLAGRHPLLRRGHRRAARQRRALPAGDDGAVRRRSRRSSARRWTGCSAAAGGRWRAACSAAPSWRW